MILFYKIQKNKLILIGMFLSLLCILQLLAFDWPQEITSLNQMRSFFAQNQQSFISHSLVFPQGDVIKLSEGGRLLFRFESNPSCNHFPSSLGNAFVFSHENDLRSVYANLGTMVLFEEEDYLAQNTEIALSGNSGWHEKNAGLEFFVIDIKNKSLINPLLVLPMNHAPLNFLIGKIFAQDGKGEYIEVSSGKAFKEGSYTFFREASDPMPLFKSLVSINGNAVDTLSYDALFLWNQELALKSNKGVHLGFSRLYPRENRQYLCETKLSRGKNTIIVQVFDILGNKKQIQYTIDVY